MGKQAYSTSAIFAQRNFLNSNLSILVGFVFAFRAASSICIPIFCWVNVVFFKVDF